MITLKQWLDAVNYKISEGSEYLWHCYGDRAFTLDYEGKDTECSSSIVFDTETQLVYQVSVSDNARENHYRLFHPEYKIEHNKEAVKRGINPKQVYDQMDYFDLETTDDFIKKLTAIVNGDSYDTRIEMELDLNEEEQRTLFEMAHRKDITVNKLVEQILVDAINNN